MKDVEKFKIKLLELQSTCKYSEFNTKNVLKLLTLQQELIKMYEED